MMLWICFAAAFLGIAHYEQGDVLLAGMLEGVAVTLAFQLAWNEWKAALSAHETKEKP